MKFYHQNRIQATVMLLKCQQHLRISQLQFSCFKFYRIQIEIILLNNSRIMKNSMIKHHRYTVSNPFSNCNTLDKCQSPQAQEHKSYINGNQAYDSNYQYFAKKIGENNHIEQEISPKLNHQRYNSLGNSRVSVKSGQPSSLHKLPNNESSPYLLQFNSKQNKNYEQKPKVTTKIDSQQYVSSPSNLTKHTMKLSMKNVHKNAFNTVSNQRQCIMKESQISTTNQTYISPSMASKYAQQKIMKDQLLKYFSVNIQKNLNAFKIQIYQQNMIITNLEAQINNLNNKLKCNQITISQLMKSKNIRKEKTMNNFEKFEFNLNPQNEKRQIYLINKINQLENQLNQVLKIKIIEQAQMQTKINDRIDKIMNALAYKANQNYLVEVNKISGDVNNFSNNLKKYSEILKRNLSAINLFKQVVGFSFNIKSKLQQVRKVFSKPLNNTSILQQTAQFKIQQSRNKNVKGSPEKQDLNDSNSYFFHPSELGNIDKITELFINRQGQPIKCYTDNFNQVKYRDTNTFMFNKKGDIVQLTEKEKRYYIDKGFIARTY